MAKRLAGKKPQLWCYDEVWHIPTQQLDGYAHSLCCRNLSWFSAPDFIENVKYAYGRKFIEVYVCQKLSIFILV